MKNKLGRIVPRWAHQAYAFLGGYFWEPCPICKRKFGGHEWNDADAVLMDNLYDGEGVCSDCAGEAGRRNKILFARLRNQ